MNQFAFSVHGVTPSNISKLENEINKIGLLVTYQDVHIAIILAYDEVSAEKLFHSVLGEINLSLNKASISKPQP